MKQHEREYFVCIVRSGTIPVHHAGVKLLILTPTIELMCEAEDVAAEAFDEAYANDIMSDDDMRIWMIEKELWTSADEQRIKGLGEDIKRLKKDIFNSRKNVQSVKQIRAYLRIGTKQLGELEAKRHEFSMNTLEGIATMAKWQWIVCQCSMVNGKQYDFSSEGFSESAVIAAYRDSILEQHQIRELARNEPWKSVWATKEHTEIKLFANHDREKSVNQQNIIVWSMMYDNIQESMDCPTDDVIEDDDMLDGWFILQAEKREKDREEKAFEESTKSDKIRSSDEIFVMTDKDNARDVMNMNAMGGKVAIRQREAVMRRNAGRGTQQNEFFDEKTKIGNQQSSMYKGKFGR